MAQAGEPSPTIEDETPAPMRIRRNTACVRCRDAKVRCNASLNPSRPCLRCSKAGQPCVFDRNHRRTSRKSKLEELAAEVRTIKEAVSPRVLATSATVAPRLRPEPLSPPRTEPLPAMIPITTSPNVTNVTPSSSTAVEMGNRPGLPPPSTAYTTPSPPSGLPAEPRALGSRVFSGEDIDYYFAKYFEHFHPYLPVVRTRDPNDCYKSGPILFWAVIVTACRRYAKDEGVFQFLVETISADVWAGAAQPPLRLTTINALLLLIAWPLPTIRLMTDPSYIFVGIAVNSCLSIGLQTGKGRHPEFTVPWYQLQTTDEEATYTWAACNLLSQRVSSYLGCPPTASLFGKTIDNILDGTVPCAVPRGFVLQLETARFSNRLSKAVAACLEEVQGVSHRVVTQMEEEFAKLQRLLYPENSDLDNFTLLSTLLELQMYYFMPLPGFSEEILVRNVARCHSTAESIIRLALKLQHDAAFLTHAPHFNFRTLLVAACVCLTVTLSPHAAAFEGDSGDAIIGDALTAMRTCSVQEGDLPVRAAKMMESYWSIRHHIPKSANWTFVPTDFAHRLGASLAFDWMRKWKREIESIRSGGPNPPAQGPDVTVEGTQVGPEAEASLVDSSQQIDWTGFMDDFDWSFTSNYLNVS